VSNKAADLAIHPREGTAEGRGAASFYGEDARLRQRRRAERRFQSYGIVAIGVSLLLLLLLVVTIIHNGRAAFTQSYITLEVTLLPEVLDKNGTRNLEDIRKVSTFGYAPLLRHALAQAVADFDIQTPLSPQEMAKLLSMSAGYQLRSFVLEDIGRIGETHKLRFLATSRIDGYMKGRVNRDSAARERTITPVHLDLADAMIAVGILEKTFNPDFIFGADASDQRPEAAGFGVAMLGSFFMMLVVLVLSLPIGVAAAIFLEEFAPRNKLSDLIEISISNLAAVPSIVFGILALSLFINYMHLPQSAPLVGGLALTFMTLPTIIIATRASLKAVPPSIRDAALGLGASKMQTVFHHVLPLAAPGIMTGTIIGLAQALGETAPLLLIGMIGFIASNPPTSLSEGLLSPNSAMTAQIYEWAKRADPAFAERAWAGILILLVFLVSMNIIAIVLRHRFEHRW